MNKKKYLILFGITALGAVAGLVYWNFWGCTDTCPLWSKAHWMALRGAAIGLSVSLIFMNFRQKAG